MVQASDPVLDDVLKAMFRIVQQIKQTVHSDTVERAAIVVLHRLKQNSPARLSDLASELMLDLSTVSRQVKALEDRGLVVRSENPADRRAVRLEIAPAGLKVIDDAWSRRNTWLAESLTDWTPEDRIALKTMLTRFADALDAPPAPNRPLIPPKTETPA
jgi:DNA-binding MarR family transcriptional regulator